MLSLGLYHRLAAAGGSGEPVAACLEEVLIALQHLASCAGAASRMLQNGLTIPDLTKLVASTNIDIKSKSFVHEYCRGANKGISDAEAIPSLAAATLDALLVAAEAEVGVSIFCLF